MLCHAAGDMLALFIPEMCFCHKCLAVKYMDIHKIFYRRTISHRRDGDQQSALVRPNVPTGRGKNTYGTSCFMLMNTGENPVASTNNLLTTVARKVKWCLQRLCIGREIVFIT
jgi:glycerol kinase